MNVLSDLGSSLRIAEQSLALLQDRSKARKSELPGYYGAYLRADELNDKLYRALSDEGDKNAMLPSDVFMNDVWLSVVKSSTE